MLDYCTVHTRKRNIDTAVLHWIADAQWSEYNDHSDRFGQFESLIFHASLDRFVVLRSSILNGTFVNRLWSIRLTCLTNRTAVSKMNHPILIHTHARTHTEQIHLMCVCVSFSSLRHEIRQKNAEKNREETRQCKREEIEHQMGVKKSWNYGIQRSIFSTKLRWKFHVKEEKEEQKTWDDFMIIIVLQYCSLINESLHQNKKKHQ